MVGHMKNNDAGAKIIDKRRNWEARVEMAILKRPSSELSVYDKLVYAILCGHANRDGNAMLYVRTIAEEASCSERQARRALSALEARHLLVRRPQSAAGQGQTFNIYEVYGFDEYRPESDGAQAPGLTVRHLLPDSHTPVCQSVTPPLPDSQAPHDSQAEPNNVFEQPLNNSSKEHIPPTPQGGREGDEEPENSELQNQKHDTGEKDRSQGTGQKPESPEISPLMGILDAFNEILPELPRAEKLTASRIRALNLRIEQAPERRELIWWRRYFESARGFPWLMGRNPNGWKATFDWLIGEDGMQKVIEGGFTPPQSAEYSPEDLRELQRKYTDERGIVDARALLRDWRAGTVRRD
jgi:hypothetical protein